MADEYQKEAVGKMLRITNDTYEFMMIKHGLTPEEARAVRSDVADYFEKALIQSLENMYNQPDQPDQS